MPRILILCEYPTLLGGERSMLSTLRAVTAAGFDVVVAAPPAGPLVDELHRRGIAHVEWRTRDDSGHRLWLADLRSSLTQVIRAVRPDLVHANSLSTARIAGPVTYEMGRRSIGHLRDIIKVSAQAVADLNQHTRLVAVSHATRNFHVAQGLDAVKCEVLYNGVDLDEFRPRTPTGYVHRDLGLQPDSQLIAVVGQLGLRKGTDVALAAAAKVATTASNAHWLIIGERTSSKAESSEFEQRLHEVASQPPLAGRAHFLGYRSDLAALLPECTLLVHAARQEPLGRVLLESAASGLAIVATNTGGTPEIFPADDNVAVLVPVDDPEAIANSVTSLLSDSAHRRALGDAARRRAEAAFDIRIAAARLVEFYRDVLQS